LPRNAIVRIGYDKGREPGAFTVEHNVYLLTIEFVGFATLVIVWFRNQREASMPANSAPGRNGSRINRPQKPQRVKFFRRLTATRRQLSPKQTLVKSKTDSESEAVEVPIPWGWPHYQDRKGRRMDKSSLTESMHYLVDCLIREKQLACDQFADIKTTNSVRALLEDRYGRVDRNSVPAHFGQNGVVVEDRSGMGAPIDPAGAMRTYRPSQASDTIFQHTHMRELRRPWGW